MERLTKHNKQTSNENGICCRHFRGSECLRVGENLFIEGPGTLAWKVEIYVRRTTDD